MTIEKRKIVVSQEFEGIILTPEMHREMLLSGENIILKEETNSYEANKLYASKDAYNGNFWQIVMENKNGDPIRNCPKITADYDVALIIDKDSHYSFKCGDKYKIKYTGRVKVVKRKIDEENKSSSEGISL